MLVPWEAHRRLKRLPAPPGYDPLLAAISPAEWLERENAWSKITVILPAHLGWWRGFETKAVLRDQDKGVAEHWLLRHRPAFYGYEPVLPAGHAWTARLRRRLQGRAYKDPTFDPAGWRWRPGLWDRLLAPVGPGVVHELNTGRVPLWALNSFCSVVLPLLLFMEWARIVLVGTDWDKSGYWYCPYESPTGQRAFYREEFEDFYRLCDVARRLPHRPVIQAVRASRNLLAPPGGLVEFEEVCRE